jgi:hypothetical protein
MPSRSTILAALVIAASTTVLAQRSDVATPATAVEFLIEPAGDGGVRCRPPEARLPGVQRLDIRIINTSALAIAFRAPEFFRQGKVTSVSGAEEEKNSGGYLVPANATVQMIVGTPPPGSYEYFCADPRSSARTPANRLEVTPKP